MIPEESFLRQAETRIKIFKGFILTGIAQFLNTGELSTTRSAMTSITSGAREYLQVIKPQFTTWNTSVAVL